MPQEFRLILKYTDQPGYTPDMDCYLRNGGYETLKKALAIQPEQPIAANNLAFLMVNSGQNLDVALSLAQTARRGMPNSPSSADTLAWVYYQKGNYLSARDLLEDAIKTAPNDANIQYHLGMTYAKLSNSADAVTHLKKAEIGRAHV